MVAATINVKRTATVAGLLTPNLTPPKKRFLYYADVEEPSPTEPPTPYLAPQRGSMDSITEILTLSSEIPKKHPLDEADYNLEDLPNSKANRLLYREFENRKAAVLHQPDISALIKGSKKRIEWAKVGGGGRCEQRLIDDLETRIEFLERCLVARTHLREGEYDSVVLESMHDELVELEQTIGGFWARPRKVGEWRYVPKNVREALRKTMPEILDRLEEFLVVNDLLYAIISSTRLWNLLLFGDRFAVGSKWYLEAIKMGEYMLFDDTNKNDVVYDKNCQALPDDGDSYCMVNDRNAEDRLAIIRDFVETSLTNLAGDGVPDIEISSWSDKTFEVDVGKKPTFLTFEEKDHLSQHTIALKLKLHSLVNKSTVLKPGQTLQYPRDLVGLTGPNIEFRGLESKGKAVVLPPKEDLGWQNAGFLKDRRGVEEGDYGYRYHREVKHRKEESDVLRQEFKHAIQCWYWLWSQYKDDIIEYLYPTVRYDYEYGEYGEEDVEGKEVEGDGEVMVIDDQVALDQPGIGDTALDETRAVDDTMFEEPPFVEDSPSMRSSNPGKTGMRFGITTPITAEVTEESGLVKKFAIEGVHMIGSPLNEDTEQSQPPTPKAPYKEPIIQKSGKKKSYCEKLNIHESHLVGTSRFCPETGETWWADTPPHFLFGETPTMAKVLSDQMKEELRKGREDLARGSDLQPKSRNEWKTEKSGQTTRSGKRFSGKEDEPVVEDEPVLDDKGVYLFSKAESIIGEHGDSDPPLSEARRGKARAITPSTPISCKVLHGDSSIINSTSSVRKTSIGLKAISMVSRSASTKKKTSIIAMTLSEKQICDECGKGFRSMEVANFHAYKTGHVVMSAVDMQEPSSKEKVYGEDEDFNCNEEDRPYGDDVEPYVEEEIVDPISHLATHQAQSTAATVVNTKSSIARASGIPEIRPALYNPNSPIGFMGSNPTSYAMAQEIGPNDYQCGWSDCNFHGDPHKLACHILAAHSGSDWTLEGFKCGWVGCPDRVRLHRGLHQHCLDAHIPSLKKPFWSSSLPPLYSPPQKSRKLKMPGELPEDAGSNAHLQHESTLGAIQKMVPTTASVQEVSEEGASEPIVINAEQEILVDLTHIAESELIPPSSSSVPSTPTALVPAQSKSFYLTDATLATFKPQNGGIRQYLPTFSKISSSFMSYFSSNGKRKRASESVDSNKRNARADTEETPVKDNKQIKIAGEDVDLVEGVRRCKKQKWVAAK